MDSLEKTFSTISQQSTSQVILQITLLGICIGSMVDEKLLFHGIIKAEYQFMTDSGYRIKSSYLYCNNIFSVESIFCLITHHYILW